MEHETLRQVEDAERGKNMFAVGLLCALYSKDPNVLKNVIRGIFEKKTPEVIEASVKLAAAGYQYGNHALRRMLRNPGSPDGCPESGDGREHRARARRCLGRIRALFHVSNHPGDLRFACVVRSLRKFRWLRPSGRRRDRRNRGSTRGLLRRKDGADHHLGARHGLEDRVPGLGRDDRDTARHR